jgi:hypothetical protein
MYDLWILWRGMHAFKLLRGNPARSSRLHVRARLLLRSKYNLQLECGSRHDAVRDFRVPVEVFQADPPIGEDRISGQASLIRRSVSAEAASLAVGPEKQKASGRWLKTVKR